MNNSTSSVTHSLRNKLLAPALLIGVAFASISVWSIYAKFQYELGDQMFHRAKLVAKAMNYAAESVSRPDELQRIVSAMGTETDVNLIVVVGGRPARVLATTHNAWNSKALAELPDKDVRENLEKATQTRQSESHTHAETAMFDFTSPLLLSQPELADRALTDGAVMVVLDMRATQAAMRQLTIEFSIGFLAAMTVLAALGYRLINHIVLRPISRISKRVEHWWDGTAEDWPETTIDDELRALSHTLGDSLTRNDVTLQELRDQKTALAQSEELLQRYLTQRELRDPYTGSHERRVGKLAAAIGAELGLDAQRIEGLRVAGCLHDIGEITLPAEILSKPGQLSKTELQLIQCHARASYDVLKDVQFPWPVAQVALQHHARMDGSGYPQGLKGEAILFEARIMAVADVVEAMSSHRPYRPGLGIDKALAEIERGRGSVYDAQVTDACIRLFREKGYTIPAQMGTPKPPPPGV